MLRVIIVVVAPRRTRVVHQHRQPIRALGHLGAERDTPRFVLEVGDDVRARSGAEGVEPRSGGFELGFLARGDEDGCAVLHERLCGHFAEARGSACDERDVVREVEEGGYPEVVFGRGVCHGGQWGAGFVERRGR